MLGRWEHEPELAGCGDGIGVASAHSEAGGPCEPPLIGGKYDDSASVALYANGNLFHANQKMATAIRKTPREAASCEVTPHGTSHGENDSSSDAHDQAEGDDIQTKDDQKFWRDGGSCDAPSRPHAEPRSMSPPCTNWCAGLEYVTVSFTIVLSEWHKTEEICAGIGRMKKRGR